MLKSAPREERTGLVVVYTGDGKGKTTAALGLLVRAAGYGWKTAVVQFVKSWTDVGEVEGIQMLPDTQLHQLGKGFVGIGDDELPLQEHAKAAQDALHTAATIMKNGEVDLVVLDEVNVAMSLGLIGVDDLIAVIDSRPDWLHVVCTGRNADGKLVERADLVTEMREVKHPFHEGFYAQRGIDY
jgi:cob(I)alamin adenosyltransferase